jgi:crossover junction endodeoxyribonuclease RusA
MAVEIILPRAPSTNRLWRIGKGKMFKSAEYTAWLQECFLLIRQQRIPLTKGRYKMIIRVFRPDKRRRDIDNYIKSTSDLLQQAGVIENDNLCESVTCEWTDEDVPWSMNVKITPVED